MREVFIDHLSFALGDEAVAVEQSAAQGKLISSPSVLKDAGFERHHICTKGTTAYDLARRAVSDIRDDLGDVGAIIYSTCIPINGNVGAKDKFEETGDVKHLMDFPASHLQADFGLNRAIVIGLNQQACTGMLGSLRIARMLMVSEPEISRVLCVTADRFPEGALYEQSYNLISDGAAACIVSTTPEGFGLLCSHSVTNGAMAQASDDETVGSFFSYTYQVIQDSLSKTGLGIKEIDWIVAQNTNRKAWQIFSRLLKFDLGRIYFPTIREIGHVISADNIINLKRLDEEKKLRSGDRVLLFMAGYGLNWQCVILEKI